MSRCTNFICAGAVLFALAVPTSAQPTTEQVEAAEADLFVSPHGDDAHPGTAEQPLQSFARAQQRIREQLAAGPPRDWKVLFRAGTYFLQEPLEFGPADSAPQGHGVTYAAYPGEEVVISGGERIDGWRKSGELLTAQLPDAVQPASSVRELFVGDRRADRARTPNEGYFRVEQAGADERTSFTFREGDLQPWNDLQTGEIVFLHDWSTSRVGLASIDPQQRVVRFRDSIGANAPHYRISNFEPHPHYYIENLAALLDAPGEWFVDPQSRTISYWPREGETAETLVAVVPRLERLIEVRGEPAEDRRVRGLRLVGLTFRHCRWLPPTHGYAAGQATFHEQRDHAQQPSQRVMIPAAIGFALADDCLLDDCTIEQIGASGVAFGQACRRNQIVHCIVRDVAGNGVNIGETFTHGEVPADGELPADTLVSTGNRVANCLIDHCGALYSGAVGIWIGIAAETEVVHNELRQLPYTGVSVGWVWNPSPSGCRGNVIAHNHIHDVMQVLSDGGGIYTLGRQPGTVLRENRIHGVPLNAGRAESNGIFMDEGSTAILVEGNTIYDLPRSPIRFHRAGVNTVRQNTLVCQPDMPPLRYNATPEHMILQENEIITAAEWNPPADDPTTGAGLPAGARSDKM